MSSSSSNELVKLVNLVSTEMNSNLNLTSSNEKLANDSEAKDQALEDNGTKTKSSSSSNKPNTNSSNSNNILRPYSVPNAKASTTPKLTIKSISSDHDDILENILDATDRRTSMFNVRSQKTRSYIPSLSVVCKQSFFLF